MSAAKVAVVSLLLVMAADAHGGSERDVAKLIRQLQSPKESDQVKAIEALTQLGPAAKEALPALFAVFNSGRHRYSIYQAIRKIDPEGSDSTQKQLADFAIATRDTTPSGYDVVKDVIRDQGLLADIARKAAYDLAREAAMDKLTDQAVLADVLKNENARHVLIQVMDRITEEKLLVDIAATGSVTARRTALARISNPSAIASIVEGHGPAEARLDALFALTDRAALQRISRTTDHPELKKWAPIVASSDPRRDLRFADTPSCRGDGGQARCDLKIHNSGSLAYRDIVCTADGKRPKSLGVRDLQPGETLTVGEWFLFSGSGGGSIEIVGATPAIPAAAEAKP